MEYLKIHNWDKWQSYRKDRGAPPWIKIQLSLFQHLEFILLDSKHRGELLTIWLIAAGNNGKIPADPSAIKALGRLESEPDLKFFVDQGFIDDDNHVTTSWQPVDNHVTTTCQPHDVTEAEVEAEVEEEKKDLKNMSENSVDKSNPVDKLSTTVDKSDPPPPKKTPAPKFNADDMEAASAMLARIRVNNPTHRQPNLETWANDIRLMRERDNRTYPEIAELFNWAQDDDFWQSNILSPDKLRKKWDQLTMRRNGNGKNGRSNETSSETVARRLDAIMRGEDSSEDGRAIDGCSFQKISSQMDS